MLIVNREYASTKAINLNKFYDIIVCVNDITSSDSAYQRFRVDIYGTVNYSDKHKELLCDQTFDVVKKYKDVEDICISREVIGKHVWEWLHKSLTEMVCLYDIINTLEEKFTGYNMILWKS